MPPAGAVTEILRLRLLAEGPFTNDEAVAIATPSRRSVGHQPHPLDPSNVAHQPYTGSIVSRLSAMSASVSVTPESPKSDFDPLVGMVVSLMFTV